MPHIGEQLDLMGSLIKPEPYAVPTLLNGWVAFGVGTETPGYLKDKSGVIRLKGMFSSGTMGLPMFTLPPGYRPFLGQYMSTVSNSAFGYFTITAAGDVTPVVGSNVWFSLNGISFRP